MGYANGLSVDPEEMSGLGAKTGLNAEDFAQQLTDLRNNVESLRAIWTGPASDTFYTSYKNQAAIFDEFQARLENLGTALQSSADEFDRTENGLANAARNLF